MSKNREERLARAAEERPLSIRSFVGEKIRVIAGTHPFFGRVGVAVELAPSGDAYLVRFDEDAERIRVAAGEYEENAIGAPSLVSRLSDNEFVMVGYPDICTKSGRVFTPRLYELNSKRIGENDLMEKPSDIHKDSVGTYHLIVSAISAAIARETEPTVAPESIRNDDGVATASVAAWGRDVVEEGGFVFDAETGEVLAAPDDAPPSIRERFKVQDQGGAEWVLRKMLEAEAALSAVDQHPDVIAALAVVANAEAMKKERRRRVDGLHARFDAELGEFARTQLAGTKSKTWKTVVGSVALRIVKGGLRVADPDAALAWAKKWAPDAVKVKEEFHVSKLDEEQKATVQGIAALSHEDLEIRLGELATDPDFAEEADGDSYLRGMRAMNAAFRVDPDAEKVVVKTGAGE